MFEFINFSVVIVLNCKLSFEEFLTKISAQTSKFMKFLCLFCTSTVFITMDLAIEELAASVLNIQNNSCRSKLRTFRLRKFLLYSVRVTKLFLHFCLY
jgi:hypothetical protein